MITQDAHYYLYKPGKPPVCSSDLVLLCYWDLTYPEFKAMLHQLPNPSTPFIQLPKAIISSLYQPQTAE